MSGWVPNDEADFPLWTKELDPLVHSLNHKRACVWQDELSGQWKWEIEYFHGDGCVASGITTGQAEAMAAADVIIGSSGPG